MAHRIASAIVPAFVLAALAFTTGCDAPGFKSKVKSPSQTAQQPIGQATTTSASAVPHGQGASPPIAQIPTVFTPGLSVSDVIAQACGIQPRGTTVSTSFEYDSAALAESDRQVLGDIAKCLSDGALRGKSVVLTGRADARGEPEYNMTLGESRADAVHRYLVDLGVGKERMRATSRGEIDATGTNEEGWASDRRVDIELAL